MNEIVLFVAAILLTIMEGTMPKPRSFLPPMVTLIAIAVLLAVAIVMWRQPEAIPDDYLLWILLTLVVVPIAFTLYTLRKENIHNILSKLDKDSKVIVEDIVGTLQQIYTNGKIMAEQLSSGIQKNDNTQNISIELYKALGFKLMVYAMSYTGDKKVRMRISLYALWDFAVFVFYAFTRFLPFSIRENMLFQAAEIIDINGVGLSSIEDTPDSLNNNLKKHLQDATRIIRTINSVNSIQKCLKYAHAVNNMYILELINKANVGEYQSLVGISRYTALTRGSREHLMAQRFAEVAETISKEL